MSSDVVVIGGGVIGLSCAFLLGNQGASVTVVDPDLGKGSSWVAAGMLAPVTESHYGEPELIELLLAGANEWEGFTQELEAVSDRQIGFESQGTLLVALDASDRLVVDELGKFHQTMGLESYRRSPSECRGLVKGLSPRVRGGLEVPRDFQVDNRRLLEALTIASKQIGVSFDKGRCTQIVGNRHNQGEEVFPVEHSKKADQISVILADRRVLFGEKVLVSAGCASMDIEGFPDGSIPSVRPVKGHILRLRAADVGFALERTVRALVRGRSCYLVPREDGTVVLGATSEEIGFDTRLQAGPVHSLLDDARTIYPGIDEMEILEISTGFRPGSLDNGPYVGWSQIERVAFATGHSRNGILLAPITARGIVDLFSGRAITGPLAKFHVSRLNQC